MSSAGGNQEPAPGKDSGGAEQLLPLVYEELRRLALSRMAREAPGHTLQPTALVHEAFLRLAGENKESWEGRAQFFSAAAEAMRRILVERVRRRQALKRGGDAPHEELDEGQIAAPGPSEEILALHECLDALGAEDPQVAELVKLRYFVGLTMADAAAALGISQRTAERNWSYARAWLRTALAHAGATDGKSD